MGDKADFLKLPWWLSLERICLQCGRPGFDPWVGMKPWRRERLPIPVCWPGEFHRTQLSDFHFTSFHTTKIWAVRQIFFKLEKNESNWATENYSMPNNICFLMPNWICTDRFCKIVLCLKMNFSFLLRLLSVTFVICNQRHLLKIATFLAI